MKQTSSYEAAEALRAIGRNVEPPGDDPGLWLVDGLECTDGELIALAHLFGLVAGSDRAQ
ncbi:hypothetical protein FV232_27370 [Methylobacterium sp. WL30]|uniref:hypothetical protein n=1 Tax=unclassified Methylobacterium TaxID=2615210 RepID=UPI0011C84F04|nr:MULTISPECIES: hypothetical protein [unclassified Methylobacterium]TXN26044.1 hypothetical protein FV225_23915 [Methylobacterium sp. WL93]TXN44863.1 hypothetical protein FV227_26085 [Methylobacterium sp. WL119]TXN61256.1 hypothetical protein FV232_27370 [Methylobacterium sp. WL30]